MIYPSADKLNKIGSKYKLITMAATRSKQIKAGMKPLIETDSTNPLTIAFEEIAAGVITANIPDIDEIEHIQYDELAKTSTILFDHITDVIDPDLFDDQQDDAEPKLDAVVAEVLSEAPIEKVAKQDIVQEIISDTPNVTDIKTDKDILD